MEKYGVDETAASELKLGQIALDRCPLCGAVLATHGSIVLCPTHGSKPFENDATEQTK